eukprot:GHVH01010768.1.p1 GENE.GHVH01010768.1~~GHVH01010768.1.p1  ORF type:complete len:1252 (+),score=139.15 GHVH01010768.1:25-3780(+)
MAHLSWLFCLSSVQSSAASLHSLETRKNATRYHRRLSDDLEVSSDMSMFKPPSETSVFAVKGLWFEISEFEDDGFGTNYYIGSDKLGQPTTALNKMFSTMDATDRYNHIISSYYSRLGLWPNFPLLREPLKLVNPVHYEGSGTYSVFDNIELDIKPWPWVDQVVHQEETDDSTPQHVWDLKKKLCTDFSPIIECENGFFSGGAFGALFEATVHPARMKERGLMLTSGCKTVENNRSRHDMTEFLRIAKGIVRDLPKIAGGRGELAGFLYSENSMLASFAASAEKGIQLHRKWAENNPDFLKARQKVRDYLKVNTNWFHADVNDKELISGYLHAYKELGYLKRYDHAGNYYSLQDHETTEEGWSDKDHPLVFNSKALISPWTQIHARKALGYVFTSLVVDSLFIAAEVMNFKLQIQEKWPGIPVWSTSGPLCTSENEVVDMTPRKVLVKLQLSENPQPSPADQRYRSGPSILELRRLWKTQNSKMLTEMKLISNPFKSACHSVTIEQGISDGMWFLGTDAELESTRHRKAYADPGRFAPRSYDIVTRQIEKTPDGTPYYRSIADLNTIIFMDMVNGFELSWLQTASCLMFPSIRAEFARGCNVANPENCTRYITLAKEILPPRPRRDPMYWRKNVGVGFNGTTAAILGDHPANEVVPSIYGSLWSNRLLPPLEFEGSLTKGLDTFEAQYALYYRDRALILQMVQRRLWTLFDKKLRHCDLHSKNIFIVPKYINPVDDDVLFRNVVKRWILGRSVLLVNTPSQAKAKRFKSATTAAAKGVPLLGLPYLLPTVGSFDNMISSLTDWFSTQHDRHTADLENWLSDGMLAYLDVDDVVNQVAFIDVAYFYEYPKDEPARSQYDGCRYDRHIIRSSDIYELFSNWNQSYTSALFVSKVTDFNENPDRQSQMMFTPRALPWLSCGRPQTVTGPHPGGVPEGFSLWSRPNGELEYTHKQLVDFYIYLYQHRDWKKKHQPTFVESDEGLMIDLFYNIFSHYHKRFIHRVDYDLVLERVKERHDKALKSMGSWWKSTIWDVMDDHPAQIKQNISYQLNWVSLNSPASRGPYHHYVVAKMYQDGLMGPYEWFHYGEPFKQSPVVFNWMTRVYSRILAGSPPHGFPKACFVDNNPSTGKLKDPLNWWNTCVGGTWLKKYKKLFDERMSFHEKEAKKILTTGAVTSAEEEQMLAHLLRTTRTQLCKFKSTFLQLPWFKRLKWDTAQDMDFTEYFGSDYTLERPQIEKDIPVFVTSIVGAKDYRM